tara:strand:+ start:454 stop:936 length:483 start_codon:yes stop_codon:yes gene_type:complete
MKLTDTKLKQLILQEMARIPAHIPITDPEIERKVADLLTGGIGDINQGAALLKPINLTKGVKESSYKSRGYSQEKIKVTEYHFKVTQSFYDAIVDQLKTKRRFVTGSWAYVIGEWREGAARISISEPYNLIRNKKHRGLMLRSDEPYVEHLHIKIIEPDI